MESDRIKTAPMKTFDCYFIGRKGGLRYCNRGGGVCTQIIGSVGDGFVTRDDLNSGEECQRNNDSVTPGSNKPNPTPTA
jgi:hypothetical protein